MRGAGRREGGAGGATRSSTVSAACTRSLSSPISGRQRRAWMPGNRVAADAGTPESERNPKWLTDQCSSMPGSTTTPADAEAHYEAVFELHAAGAIGTFDSAVIEKDEDGKVHVHKTEEPLSTVPGPERAWAPWSESSSRPRSSAARSSAQVLGTDRPPEGRRARDDLKDLGDELEAGTAAAIVLGESKIEEQLEKAVTRSNKPIEKQVDADADELKREIDAAAKEDAK